MTNAERARRLTEAMKLINEVNGSLDHRSQECACCGHTRYENWDEQQVSQRLDAALTRLKQCTGRVRGWDR